MKAIAILISPTGEEFFDAYGPMTKDHKLATKFASREVATQAAMNRFGRTATAFWESERQAEQTALQRYMHWNYRIENIPT